MPYDLTPAARAAAALLDKITDDRLDDPTPCGTYLVRDLLSHLLGLSAAFRDAARKDLGVTTDTAPAESPPELPGSWRIELPKVLGEIAEAWRDPRAWEGETRAGGFDMPAAVAGQVALNELVLHGWDLARGTGQPYTIDDATTQAEYDFLSQVPDDQRGALFGPVVEVPADAPPLDRVIGLGGRDPYWTPPATT